MWYEFDVRFFEKTAKSMLDYHCTHTFVKLQLIWYYLG
jgi:hypothetical protein